MLCLSYCYDISAAPNTEISPNFLVWKFCGNTQFAKSFEQLAQYFAETLRFRKILTSGNQVKIQYLCSDRGSQIPIHGRSDKTDKEYY